MAKMERLATNFEFKFASDAPDATFSGYGSVFNNEDHGGDLILRGAFKESLADWEAKSKLPKMLLQHGGGFFGQADDMVPIGKWTAMSEDRKGLYCEGRLFGVKDTDRGRRIYEAMKEAELDGLSIGYRAREYEIGTKPDEPYRTLKKVDLYEVSVVLFGMNDQALIDSVKSSDIDDLITLSDCEDFLREADGRRFTKKTARDFVSRLSKIARREAGDDQAAELLESIRSTRKLFIPN